MAHELQEMMKHQFQMSREVIFDPATPLIYLKKAFVEGFSVIFPS